MSSDFLEGLNPAQREAVTAPTGHVLVLAGAGSGKTRVLVSRIAWLIQTQHIPAEGILAVTFTNKAAGEMKQRLQQLLNYSMSSLWVGTFHGLCHRLLRLHHQQAGLAAHFQILDSDEQARLVKQLIQAKQLDEGQWPVKVVQSYINSRKEEGTRARHIPAMAYGPSRIYGELYEAYEAACLRLGCVDFAELILRCCELFRDHADILQHYQSKFRAILVDEFQDTNTIQYTWIRLLAGSESAVMAVGDDDQSIYGWRGAKIENIHQFQRDFLNTQMVRLEQNYRSTSTILAAANGLIVHNLSRLGKELWTAGEDGQKIVVYGAFNELDEARFVAERINMAIREGYQVDAIAVLYRSNVQSRVLEEALLRYGIAYRIYGGVRFLERAEIKDALAYLRLLVNQDDDGAFERIVNVPARGIGERTLEQLRVFGRKKQLSLWQATVQLSQEHDALSSRAKSALLQFLDLIAEIKIDRDETLLETILERVIEKSGLMEHYGKNKTEEGQARVENLAELVNAARQYRMDKTLNDNETWVTSFLAHASLEAGDLQAPSDVPAVHLMTIHAAKGLEFPMVMMVGVEEGVFPSKASLDDAKRLEEERRLCYVGMTRAMERLCMSYAEVRRQYGREEYHRPSRFLRELPDEALDVVRGLERPQTQVKGASMSSRVSDEWPYALGQKVVHPTFGEGMVLGYEGGGAHLRVQVRFQQAGTKWLVVAYARLAV
ncbi:MAG: DNA helicase II [Gammaproteobacteria bacterium]|nr:DNA helicase II [Gammaproteobacteria bacterium]